MKALIKKWIPQAVQDEVYLIRMRAQARRETRRDLKRYLRWAAPEDRVVTSALTARGVEALATKDYHRVEKGLALAAPARPFGSAVSDRLQRLIPLLESESPVASYARTALDALDSWNVNGDRSNVVSPHADDSDAAIPEHALKRFFEQRRSVRHFDPTRGVPHQLLELAVGLASNTPSVCNRQAWHVWFAHDRLAKERLLAFQNGNRGFGASAPSIALVTADARLFTGPNERNQGWIDGSLFAMSLVWALHGLGVGTCMLNMSSSNDVTEGLRETFSIPDHELVIMMIAIGYPVREYRIARSPRRPHAEIASTLT